MDIPATLRADVQKLDRHIAAHQKAEDEARTTAISHEEAAARQYENMGFRERRLRGWFGGDTVAVERYRSEKNLSAEFNARADNLAQERQALDRQIDTILDAHLVARDPVYQSLVEPLDKAQQAQAAIDNFKEKVQNALDAIDSAQSVETMDMFTKNKGISVMSSFSNASARDAVNAVKASAPDFQAAMQNYGAYLKDYKVPAVQAGFGDMTDLIFDFAFGGGFDFMSIFTLSALGNAEDKMEDVREAVDKAAQFVSENRVKVEQALNQYRQKVRQFCLQ